MSAYTLPSIIVGDRGTWSFRIYDDGLDNDLSAATVVINMWAINGGTIGTQEITNGSCTVQPGVSFTAAVTDKCTATAHGLKDGHEVVLSTSSDLPAPLSASSRYFVIERTPNTFKLSLEPNGEPVNITDTGTGTHTIKAIGHCIYVPASGDVDTAGKYVIKLKRTIAGIAVHFPNGDQEYVTLTISALPS